MRIINILLQVIDTMTFKRYLWKYTILTKYQQFWSQMMPWLKNNFENIFEIFLKCLETLFRYRNENMKKYFKTTSNNNILNNILNIILMFVGGRTGSDFTEYCFLIWLFAHLYVATVGNHVLYHQKEMNSPWNMKRYIQFQFDQRLSVGAVCKWRHPFFDIFDPSLCRVTHLTR